MSLLRWIIAFPIIVGVLIFALAHPDLVTVTWSPLHDSFKLPLYFVVLIFLAIGFLLGAFIAWINFLPAFSEKRALKKRVKSLEKDLNESKEKLIEALSKKRDDENRTLSYDE
ncbi:MAG: LapA family protein [Pseudomonadota bacterium]